MDEFRLLTENKIVKGIGIGLICLALGLGTYMVMYQPDSTMTVQFGDQAQRPATIAPVTPVQTVPRDITENVMPTTSPTISPGPMIPPRSQYTLKVQNAGGSPERVVSILQEARIRGYQAQEADVPGKVLPRTVIRYKPGLEDVAARAAGDLAPGAQLEAHSDISVDLVVAVGKS